MTDSNDQLPHAGGAEGGAASDDTARRTSEHEAAAWSGLLERLEPTLAHDLRGPLNALTLHLELLRRVVAGLEPAPQAERVQRSLESLDREVERLTHRIDGVLRLVGALRNPPFSFTLASLLEECENQLRTVARHRGVTLRIDGGSGALLRQREALWRAVLLLAFETLERAAAGDAVELSCELHGDHADVQVATVSSASASSVQTGGEPPPIDLPLARALAGRCGGELVRAGSSWRLRFPVEVDS